MQDFSKELEALHALPEGIGSADLEPYWIRLLDSWEVAPADPEQYAECFHELASRQWHSYDRVGELVERRVAVWISRVWTVHNESMLEYCTGLIGLLGLDSCLELIRAAMRNPSVSPGIRQELEQDLESWGSPPLDPWRSLR